MKQVKKTLKVVIFAGEMGYPFCEPFAFDFLFLKQEN
jgi:hypothetical protein